MAAYQNAPGNTSNAAPATTRRPDRHCVRVGPFLHQAANNPAYVVAHWDGDTGDPGGVTITAATPAAADVYVGPASRAATLSALRLAERHHVAATPRHV